MKQVKKKRVYKGRNTGKFYFLLTQLPGYNAGQKDTIADGTIDEFLVGRYGLRHGRKVSLSSLTDEEYEALLSDVWQKVKKGKSIEVLQEENLRKKWYHKILMELARIGVYTTEGYQSVNKHILSLPLSKGRIMPQFPTDELEDLFRAVCSYCDNISKRQWNERETALRN